ncbi:hypothetical protein Y1Q_0022935 [Alligator mississippiensis]|uniref:Uncharacterized protein n=1 Tax=Alligator mississippiensis TaxID=8496 RepID=A0A151MHW6_ALLMI|nr:hypothetical protein Y1Q_0022935 [Alligator mississippiensis]
MRSDSHQALNVFAGIIHIQVSSDIVTLSTSWMDLSTSLGYFFETRHWATTLELQLKCLCSLWIQNTVLFPEACMKAASKSGRPAEDTTCRLSSSLAYSTGMCVHSL